MSEVMSLQSSSSSCCNCTSGKFRSPATFPLPLDFLSSSLCNCNGFFQRKRPPAGHSFLSLARSLYALEFFCSLLPPTHHLFFSAGAATRLSLKCPIHTNRLSPGPEIGRLDLRPRPAREVAQNDRDAPASPAAARPAGEGQNRPGAHPVAAASKGALPRILRIHGGGGRGRGARAVPSPRAPTPYVRGWGRRVSPPTPPAQLQRPACLPLQ